MIKLLKKIFFIDETSNHIGLSALNETFEMEHVQIQPKRNHEMKLSDLMRKAG